MRVLVAPDSFKGSMSAVEVCDITRRALEASLDECQVDCIPVADGGEGSVDCFLSAMGGELLKCESVNPFFEKMESFYGLLNNGKTAVELLIENANKNGGGDNITAVLITTEEEKETTELEEEKE